MPVNAGESRVRVLSFSGVLENPPILATVMPQFVASLCA
jgi:hypothetical protein